MLYFVMLIKDIKLVKFCNKVLAYYCTYKLYF